VRAWNVRAAAVALVFLTLSAFLPWELSGDLIPYRTPGVRLSPRLADSGGVAILACAVLTAWAIVGCVRGRESAFKSLRAFALLAFALLVVQFADVFRRGPQFNSEVGAPVPDFGLYLALACSLVLIVESFVKERRVAA